MYDASDLRNGHVFEDEGKLLRVLNYHHNKTGRGGAVIKLKVKDVLSGAITEKSCRPGDKFKPGNVERQKFQFLYREGDDFHFMNLNDFNQISVPLDTIDDAANYLTENLEIHLSFWQEKPIGVDLPPSLNLKVEYTEPGIKGDTVSGATKVAKMETGFEIKVPLFIEIDNILKVDTRTGEYLERA
jgi:elongation factor P